MAQDNDADEVLSIMKATSARAVMVDSYLLGARWQGRIRTACPHLVVFDDLVDRQIEAAIAINAAGDRGMYGRLAPGALVLCGLEYAVVHAPRTLPPRLDRPGAVLVAFGASDRANATSAVLSALRATRRDDDPFDTWIQLGADAPHRGQVQQAADTLGWARLLDPGESIDADRRNISIAIGASGVSLYERMRDGIPGIMVPLAENQRRIAMAAQSCGAAVIARSESEAAGIAIALRRSISKLREMSRSGRSAVDGLGAKRIAATISACFA
jgi:spore coat polysaccharide biosynthesis predicted glycosyltransferase SpsG